MAERKVMHPPGSPQHGIAIVIAAHPAGPKGSDRMPPPGMKVPDDAPPDAETPDNKDPEGKASPEDAGVVREDAHCVACQNYDATSGMCAKVSGQFSPDDACSEYFTPLKEGDQDEPDADDQGGPPDNDADDQVPPPQQAQ